MGMQIGGLSIETYLTIPSTRMGHNRDVVIHEDIHLKCFYCVLMASMMT